MKSPFLFFLKLYFKVSLTPIENSIRNELFNKHTYRIPEKLNGKWKSLALFIKLALKLLFSQKLGSIKHAEIVVLDAKSGLESKRRSYLNIDNNLDVRFIFRQDLPNVFDVKQKLILLFDLITLILLLLPRFILKKNREKTALVVLEFIECELILEALRRLGCNQLFVFGAFEKDSAFQQYMFKKQGIRVTIIPSGNPIKLYYKTVIASQFAFTTPYQNKEFEGLKNLWEVDRFFNWPIFDYKMIPLKKEESKSPVKLAFMSSGMHLRILLGYQIVGDGALQRAETKLVEMLKKALQHGLIDELVVYLHPLEKRNSYNLQRAKNFYIEQLGENISFGPIEVSSRDTFSEIEVAIASFSSVLMERLYGGHKVIFAPMGELPNFYSDERLESITINSLRDFEKIYPAVLNDDNYFLNHSLTDYLHTNREKIQII